MFNFHLTRNGIVISILYATTVQSDIEKFQKALRIGDVIDISNATTAHPRFHIISPSMLDIPCDIYKYSRPGDPLGARVALEFSTQITSIRIVAYEKSPRVMIQELRSGSWDATVSLFALYIPFIVINIVIYWVLYDYMFVLQTPFTLLGYITALKSTTTLYSGT